MGRKRLTDRTLKALKPAPPGSRYDVMDSAVPGLGIRVGDKGQRTFIFVARYPGSSNPTRRALGEYGVLTLDKAREKARHWHSLIRQGRDPKKEEEGQRLVEQRRQENSFAAVVEDFLRLAVIGPNLAKPKQRKAPYVARALRDEFVNDRVQDGKVVRKGLVPSCRQHHCA
jgi:hypothetical protein